jgi:uncharacterized protein (TIGR00297 family)
MHQTHEPLRKSIHVAAGAGALTLRWLPWPIVALVCVAATVSNWLLLHRLVGRRVARHERGYDAGIVLYPAMVLVVTLLFREQRVVIGVAWVILAFGDGFATLVGKGVRGPALPWNGDKTWSGFGGFIAFGFVASMFIFHWLEFEPAMLPPALIVGTAVAASAIVESLGTHIDDNITVTLTAAFVMGVMIQATHGPVARVDWVWLAVNAVLAIAGYLAKTVDLSGFIGGFLLGAVILLFGGWQLYVVLLAFFVIGTAATKLGYRRKAAKGLAQEKGGRRGFAHAFANTGMAAVLVTAASMLGGSYVLPLWMAAAAALATAAADTTASEIGQLAGRTAFLPLTFHRVEPGTEGAISAEGTVAGVIAAAVVAAVAVFAFFQRFEPRWFVVLVAAAVIGSYLESVIGSWNRRQATPVPNGVLNFVNTALGAAIVLIVVA